MSAPLIAGDLLCAPVAVVVEDAGKKPGVVFTFVAPDGTPYQPIVLLADDDQLAKLRPIILGAVAAARREAKL